MRLEDMAITLRPRSAWEAIDLGYAMTQAWSKPVFAAWCAVYLPAAMMVNLLCWKMPSVAVFVLWWLKPAFDRVVLHVLAGATFGDIPSLRQTLRALPQLWLKSGLFAALSYTRFNFARSFTLPVMQLEGSRGKLAHQRRRILGREGWGAAVWLTIFSLVIEVTLIASCYFLVGLLSPGEPALQFSWQALFNANASRGAGFFANAVNALTVSILEPFYVAAGFAIYLNCRTAIEGWDVELAFKRLAARVDAMPASRKLSTVKLAASIVLGLSLSVAVVHAPEVSAQSCPVTAPGGTVDDAGDAIAVAAAKLAPEPFTPDSGARKAASRVLAAPEFGQYQDGWRIRYVGPSWGESEPRKPPKVAWLQAFVNLFAESVRVLAWIAVALVVAGLLYLLARYLSINGWRRGPRAAPPDMLFGLDVRPGSLPDDVPAAARALAARGEIRAAIALLYRGALVSLIQAGRIEIARGDTEGECLQQVRRAYAAPAESGKTDYFAALIAQWQRVAYARADIAAAEIAPLVDRWARYFSLDARQPVRARGDHSPQGAR